MTEVEFLQRRLDRAQAHIAALETPRYVQLRQDIRKGVHPLVLMITYNMDVYDLLSELCFMAGCETPAPSAQHKSWREWIGYFGPRSLM